MVASAVHSTEILLIFWIHDSLIINIIMLIYPIESLKHWQMAHSVRRARPLPPTGINRQAA